MKRKIIRTHDGLMTLDAARIESTSVFLLGELERIDSRINMPLQAFTWSRDVPVRTDIALSDEVSSYTRDFFAAPGNMRADGKHWIGSDSTQIAGPQVSKELIRNPLNPWGMEVQYNVLDLEKSMAVGRPINTAKIDAVQRIYQGELDEFAYAGDPMLKMSGLINLSGIPITPASAKSGGGTTWTPSTAAKEILADINELILSTLETSNQAVAPSRILMPYSKYNIIATTNISEAGEKSMMNYLKENNISNEVTGRTLEILPGKWLNGAGVSGSDRMIAYTPDEQYVRIPVLPLLRTPLEQRGLFFSFVYYTVIGGVENVYPETIGYMDGI